jgi:hypothetical protein
MGPSSAGPLFYVVVSSWACSASLRSSRRNALSSSSTQVPATALRATWRDCWRSSEAPACQGVLSELARCDKSPQTVLLLFGKALEFVNI